MSATFFFVRARLLFFVLSLAIAGKAAAAPGFLDPTFGDTGMTTTDLADIGFVSFAPSVARDAEGRLYVLVSGTMTQVLRYSADGVLDSSFGIDGRLSISEPEGYWIGIAVDDSDRILLAGVRSDFRAGVARVEGNGVADPSFGSGGFVSLTVDFFQAGAASALLLDISGDILVTGSIQSFGQSTYTAFVARLDASGAPVTTFGDNGITYFAREHFESDAPSTIVRDDDGNLVVCNFRDEPMRGGVTYDEDGVVVGRMSDTGALDTAWGDGGMKIIDLEIAMQCAGIVPRAGGALSIAAMRFSTITVARTLPSGALDPSFDGDGRDDGPIQPPANSYPSHFFLLPDGKILSVHTSGSLLFLARLQGSAELATEVAEDSGGGGGGGGLGWSTLLVLFAMAGFRRKWAR